MRTLFLLPRPVVDHSFVELPVSEEGDYWHIQSKAAYTPFSLAQLQAAADALDRPSAEKIAASQVVYARLMGPSWLSTLFMNYTLGYETLAGLARTPVWLSAWPTEFEKDSLCELAARRGELALMHQACNSGCPMPGPEIGYWAAHGGHLHVLDWFTTRAECPTLSEAEALLSGPERARHAKDWTRTRVGYGRLCAGDNYIRCELSDAWLGAAHANRPEVLRWLRTIAMWLDGGARACARAAAAGQLEALQTLRANGAPWDSAALAGAVANGHAAVAAWLRANGAPAPPRPERVAA